MEDGDIIALYLERNQKAIAETEKNMAGIVIQSLITYFTMQRMRKKA